MTPAVKADPHGHPVCEHGVWTFAGADFKRSASKWRCPTAQPRSDRPPPPRQKQAIAEQAPAIELDPAERDRPASLGDKQAAAADPLRPPSIDNHDGLPIFPDTPQGRAARLAYYEPSKLTNPPNSLLDYNDAKRGLEPPAERCARQRRDNPRPR